MVLSLINVRLIITNNRNDLFKHTRGPIEHTFLGAATALLTL
jgi:hypothetical protein